MHTHYIHLPCIHNYTLHSGQTYTPQSCFFNTCISSCIAVTCTCCSPLVVLVVGRAKSKAASVVLFFLRLYRPTIWGQRTAEVNVQTDVKVHRMYVCTKRGCIHVPCSKNGLTFYRADMPTCLSSISQSNNIIYRMTSSTWETFSRDAFTCTQTSPSPLEQTTGRG